MGPSAGIRRTRRAGSHTFIALTFYGDLNSLRHVWREGIRFVVFRVQQVPLGGDVKSVVCIKRVPDTESRIKIKDDKTGIDTAGVKYIISPYDEFAIEAAIKFKEAKGEGEVVAVSVGEAAA